MQRYHNKERRKDANRVAQLKHEKERIEQEEKARKAREAAKRLKAKQPKVKSSGNWMQKRIETRIAKPKSKKTGPRYFRPNTLEKRGK